MATIWGRANPQFLRTVCRSTLNDLQVGGAQQGSIHLLAQFQENNVVPGKLGTAKLFLPPQLSQTVRLVRPRKELASLEELAAAREFSEVQSELLAKLAVSSTATSAAVLGVDPDCSGAIAIVHVNLTESSALNMLRSADVSIYDMPTERVPTAKRFRKQADPLKVCSIVSTVRDGLQEGSGIQAVLEKPIPGPLNGTFSVFGTGFAYGLWAGILAAHRIGVETVAARTWKGDLGLNGLGKEGSLAMALQLFPQAHHLLRRKMDHGRAEALLLLAWAAGVRAGPLKGQDASTAVPVALTSEHVEAL